MKNKSKEVDVDFIGGQGPMTKEEAAAISVFIKSQKALQTKKESRLTRPVRQRKVQS